MPTININKRDLLNLVGKRITDEQLKEDSALANPSVDNISGLFGKTSTSTSVDVTFSKSVPNMEILSFIGIKKGLKEYKVNKSKYVSKINKKVNKIRPFAVNAVVKNINLNDSAIKSLMQMV
jgi:phenylalanyl-tRNA synthetase beta chain